MKNVAVWNTVLRPTVTQLILEWLGGLQSGSFNTPRLPN